MASSPRSRRHRRTASRAAVAARDAELLVVGARRGEIEQRVARRAVAPLAGAGQLVELRVVAQMHRHPSGERLTGSQRRARSGTKAPRLATPTQSMRIDVSLATWFGVGWAPGWSCSMPTSSMTRLT